MAGSTIDHMVALTVFLAALLLFIGLFNQTIQTAILYQNHRYLASKCTDLLDNVLLSPGYPTYWGMSNSTPTSFGLQDPEFTQYRLSPFSLMRLMSLTGEPINYPKTGKTYSNITMGFGDFLLVPFNQVVNYSTAARLLGTNGSYGFQLNVSPIIQVSISEFRSSDPLIVTVNVTGKGSPLSNAILSYCFLTVEVKGGEESYPGYTTEYGNAFTDEDGKAFLQFNDVTKDTTSYALIVYAQLSGLTGLGYTQRVADQKQFIIPLIDDFAERKVLIAHSYDVHYFGPPEAALFYNATFVLLTEDFTLREMPIENSTGKIGKVNYGEKWPYGTVTIPTTNPGILIVTYRKGNEGGIVMMPWGLSSMAFTITFGEKASGREWVATDTRQVIVSNVAYQAQLALWSLEGYQVSG